MSVFPRRTPAGGTIVIHSRFASRHPALVGREVIVETPGGARRTIEQRTLAFLPRPATATSDLAQALPPALIAEYLGQGRAKAEWLVRFFGDMKRSVHGYASYQLPPDAAPGRYVVHLSFTVAGRRLVSDTARFDHFFVDAIRIAGMHRSRGTRTLAIENLSPEPTPVQVWLPARGARELRGRVIRLAPRAKRELAITACKAFVSYAHDTRVLAIHEDGEPFVRRNERYEFRDVPERDEVLLVDTTHRAIALRGAARAIWLGASGFATRSELRTRRACRAYDALLDQRMIVETDGEATGTSRNSRTSPLPLR